MLTNKVPSQERVSTLVWKAAEHHQVVLLEVFFALRAVLVLGDRG